MTIKEKLILIKSREDAEFALKDNISAEQRERLNKTIDTIEAELKDNPSESKIIPTFAEFVKHIEEARDER